MELRRYLEILRRGWLALVIATCVGLGMGIVTSALSPFYYSSTAYAVIVVKSSASASVAELAQAEGVAQLRAATYAELATSPMLLRSAIEDLQLDTTADDLATRVFGDSTAGSAQISVSSNSLDAPEAAAISNTLMADLKSTILADSGTKGLATFDFVITQPATVPTAPASPTEIRNLILGLLIGLGAGIVLLFTRRLIDTRVRSVDDVTTIAPFTLLATFTGDSSNVERGPFTRLGANIEAMTDLGKGPALVLTSPTEAEAGYRTRTLLGLALALEHSGAKVVVLDANIQFGALTQELGLVGSAGLTDVLGLGVEYGPLLVQFQAGVMALPAGHIETALHEPPKSSAARRLVDSLSKAYDYVLIDAPALLSSSEAVIWGRAAKGILLVAAAGRTRRRDLRAAVEYVEVGGAQVAGNIVVNLSSRDMRDSQLLPASKGNAD